MDEFNTADLSIAEQAVVPVAERKNVQTTCFKVAMDIQIQSGAHCTLQFGVPYNAILRFGTAFAAYVPGTSTPRFCSTDLP
jgi:hypothetical protein